MTGQDPIPHVDFEDAYRSTPPWEIERPQPALVELAPSLVGPILDVGCGTGENALELARHGHEVVAVDSSPVAIERARTKASARGIDVDFIVADAHALATLGRRFATVVDSALLHVIAERVRYADQLAQVIHADGALILLEISDAAPIPYPKISEAGIRTTFAPPVWQVEHCSPAEFETHLGIFPAWLAIARPTGQKS